MQIFCRNVYIKRYTTGVGLGCSSSCLSQTYAALLDTSFFCHIVPLFLPAPGWSIVVYSPVSSKLKVVLRGVHFCMFKFKKQTRYFVSCLIPMISASRLHACAHSCATCTDRWLVKVRQLSGCTTYDYTNHHRSRKGLGF